MLFVLCWTGDVSRVYTSEIGMDSSTLLPLFDKDNTQVVKKSQVARCFRGVW